MLTRFGETDRSVLRISPLTFARLVDQPSQSAPLEEELCMERLHHGCANLSSSTLGHQ